MFFLRSRSGYDSSSGGESDNEYNAIAYRGADNQSQNQNTNTSSHGQGKHINKGRWTKEEVIENFMLNILVKINLINETFKF